MTDPCVRFIFLETEHAPTAPRMILRCAPVLVEFFPRVEVRVTRPAFGLVLALAMLHAPDTTAPSQNTHSNDSCDDLRTER
jgi:hypothetical protein